MTRRPAIFGEGEKTIERTAEGGTIQAGGRQRDNATFWSKGRKFDYIRPYKKHLGLLHALCSFLRGIRRRDVSVTKAHLWASNCSQASDTPDVAEITQMNTHWNMIWFTEFPKRYSAEKGWCTWFTTEKKRCSFLSANLKNGNKVFK